MLSSMLNVDHGLSLVDVVLNVDHGFSLVDVVCLRCHGLLLSMLSMSSCFLIDVVVRFLF